MPAQIKLDMSYIATLKAGRVTGRQFTFSGGIDIALTWACCDHSGKEGLAGFIPLPSMVFVGTQPLGYATPTTGLLGVPPHTTDRDTRLHLPLTSAQMRALEDVRDGGVPARIRVDLVYHGVRNGKLEGAFESRTNVEFDISRDDWKRALKDAGFRDPIIVELPRSLPGVVGEFLRAAEDARQDGRHPDAILSCRKACEALREAGYVPRAPRSVRTLLGSEEARGWGPSERLAAYYHFVINIGHLGGHHRPGAPELDATDSASTLAITAALARDLPRFRAASEEEE